MLPGSSRFNAAPNRRRSRTRCFWGGYSGYFADPDGHLWELAHNPFMQLDADGHMTLPE